MHYVYGQQVNIFSLFHWLAVLISNMQARIQDFEMGGEMRKRKSENQRNQILFQYLRDKKKKERRGLRKRRVKIHPFHLPWIRTWHVKNFISPCRTNPALEAVWYENRLMIKLRAMKHACSNIYNLISFFQF